MSFAKRSTPLVALLIAATLGVAACGSSGSGDQSTTSSAASKGPSGKVYFLSPGQAVVRFTRFDEPFMKKSFAKRAPNIKFEALDSGGDSSRQLAQAETAISNGAKAIILTAPDPKQAAGLLAKAAVAGIPVITYAPQADGGPVYAHVTVPFLQIGEQQGQYFAEHLPKVSGPVRLAEMYGDPSFPFYQEQKQGFDKYIDPLVKQGKVRVVCKADALGFAPAKAQTAMEQCLTKTHNGVDAALVMNDDTGGGVMAAVQAAKVKPFVLYGGYDATIEAVRRVVAGQQAATMTGVYSKQADAAVQLAIAAMNKQPPPKSLINGTIDNSYKKPVPTDLVDNILITPDNIQQTVVDAGLYTKSAICQGIALKSDFCKGSGA